MKLRTIKYSTSTSGHHRVRNISAEFKLMLEIGEDMPSAIKRLDQLFSKDIEWAIEDSGYIPPSGGKVIK